MAIKGQASAGMEPFINLLLEECPNLFQRLGIHLHAVGGYDPGCFHILAPFKSAIAGLIKFPDNKALDSKLPASYTNADMKRAGAGMAVLQTPTWHCYRGKGCYSLDK